MRFMPQGADWFIWEGLWITTGIFVVWGLAAFQTNQHLNNKEERNVLINLLRVSQELGSTLNLEKVSDMAVDIANTLFSAHTVGFYIIKKEEGRAILNLQRIISSYKHSFTNLSVDVPQKSCILDAIEEKKTLCIRDIHKTDDAVIPKIGAFHSVVIAPVIFENESVGIIFIINNMPNAYSIEDAQLLGMLANQIAICLKNVDLYETTAQMAITDSLTGLYCHGYFQDSLIKDLHQAKYKNIPYSLAIIDVDFFKQINDTYGHPQGDYFLRQLAGLIKLNMRKTDLVARYGGDEFTISMPGLDRMAASVVAEKLRQEVETYQFVTGSRVVKVTISIGVASFPESAQTSKELIVVADEALYDAKHRGRNQVVYR